MQLRNLSLNTQDSYLGYVRRFEAFFGKPLEDMGAEEVRLYLHDAIARRSLSAAGTAGERCGFAAAWPAGVGARCQCPS